MRFLPQLRGIGSRGELFRGALTILAGTGAAQVIIIVSSPVLTRLYSPSDYGFYAVGTALLGLLIAVACLRFEFAIPLPPEDRVAADILALSLIVAAATGLVTGLVLWMVGAALFAFLGAATLSSSAMLIVLAQLSGGMSSGLVSWHVRTKQFRGIAVSRLSQSGSQVVVQVLLGVLRFGAEGLILGIVLGNIASTIQLFRGARQGHTDAFRSVSRSGIIAAARRYVRFPLISTPAALIANLGLRAPLLVLVAVYGPTTGGEYALAERLCYLPLTVVGGAVGQVFVAEGARLARQGAADLRPLFLRTTWTLTRVAVVPAVIVAVAAPLLAGLVFGAEWAEAGVYVSILTPMFAVAFVLSSTGDILYVLERQGLFLIREIFRLVLLGGAVVVASAMHLSPRDVVIVLSGAGCATYIVYGAISWLAISQRASRSDTPIVPPAGPLGGSVIELANLEKTEIL